MVSISFIIPVYNVEPYVNRCLESVLSQDMTGVNMECIIVDDCGQDHSMELVRQLVDSYNGSIRFMIVEHEKNRGLSAARNTGLSHATGDYIMFIDSDDYLMPDSIGYFLDNIKQYPEVDVYIGNVKDCKSGETFLLDLVDPILYDSDDQILYRYLNHQIYPCAWNKLIRRRFLQDKIAPFIEGVFFEDMTWSYHLLSCASSVLLLPKVTYVYTYNQSSIMNTVFNPEKAEKTLLSYIVNVNDLLDFPAVSDRNQRKVRIGYLLYLGNFLMRGVDLFIRYSFPDQLAKDFLKVRKRLLSYSLRKGYLLVSCFFLLLFFPFTYLQKLYYFRRYYYILEKVTRIMGRWL